MVSTGINVERSTTAPPSPRYLDAVLVGTVFADLIFRRIALPHPGEETWADDFSFSPGGVANRAVAAARLGLDTGLVSRLGDDELSRSVLSLLQSQTHLRLEWLCVTAGDRLPVSVALTNEQDRSFLSYAAPGWADNLAPAHPLPAVRVLQCHLTATGRDWIRALRREGTIVIAGTHWDPTGTWPASDLGHLSDADIFVCNEVEAMNYTRCRSCETAVRELAQQVGIAVVTRGAGGAIAVDERHDTVVVPAAQVTPVDTTGAGDAFLAGLMAGIVAADPLGWDLPTQLWLASLTASLSVQQLGGAVGAPRPTEIADYLMAHPSFDQPDDAILEWAERQGTSHADDPGDRESSRSSGEPHPHSPLPAGRGMIPAFATLATGMPITTTRTTTTQPTTVVRDERGTTPLTPALTAPATELPVSTTRNTLAQSTTVTKDEPETTPVAPALATPATELPVTAMKTTTTQPTTDHQPAPQAAADVGDSVPAQPGRQP